MLLEPTPDVERDTRIQAVVSTAQNVNTVGQDRYRESSRWTRSVDAGYLPSSAAGRIGRDSRLPPQLGQTPANTSSAQSLQNVHSNVQIMAF
jgi:hypothetical protein